MESWDIVKTKGTQDFTYEQRLQLDGYLKGGVDKKEIAESLGVCLSTVYREIKRGLNNGVYDPNYSEQRHQQLKTIRGKKDKFLTDSVLAQQISDLILKENLSPEKVIVRLNQKNIECPTKSTIYSAIDKGIIPGVTREDLRSKTIIVFSHGIIQIPMWVRDKINLKDGDHLKIEMIDDKITLKKCET